MGIFFERKLHRLRGILWPTLFEVPSNTVTPWYRAFRSAAQTRSNRFVRQRPEQKHAIASHLYRTSNPVALVNEMEVLIKTQTRWNRLREILNLTRCQSTISHLYISKNKFAAAGISRLAAALCLSRSVQHLELAHCDISPVCGEALGNMLAENRSIKTLVLAWNRLGFGVVALAKGLADNTALDTLDLSWNGCGYEDTMAAISQALTTDTLGLRKLQLDQNRIKPEQAVILAEGVARSLSLRHISLDGNPLGSMGRYRVQCPYFRTPLSLPLLLTVVPYCALLL
jgi:hypothetical protein